MKRLQNIDIKPSAGELDIDIMEQKFLSLPLWCVMESAVNGVAGHGEAKIVMHQGKQGEEGEV
ncbi:hypothetical protein [Salibacterium salarium]|uniref:hypothetical protein n=1 Tax=Salibacterium salarium TaxID=284579 RepID=UPI001FE59EC4|nr:hypothetical protein [Salibacterium salarium]